MSFLPFTFETSEYWDSEGPEIKFTYIVFLQDCDKVKKGNAYPYGMLNLNSGNLYLTPNNPSEDLDVVCFKPLITDHSI